MTTLTDRIPFWTPLHSAFAAEAYEQAMLEAFTPKFLEAIRRYGASDSDGFNVGREELCRTVRRLAEQRMTTPTKPQ